MDLEAYDNAGDSWVQNEGREYDLDLDDHNLDHLYV